ncbi:MAG: SDR family oxidoreductase [Phycisphaerales bacterium]|jgi:NAD(P)-dependent dehydrogenase (short-subunit alcohol dehydrogenase family)
MTQPHGPQPHSPSRPTPGNDTKAAIITGGTAGIGLAAARQFIERGWRVLIVGRDQGRLNDALLDLGGRAQGCPADVGSAGGPGAIVGACLKAFGRIDALVNNAGVAPLVPLAQHTPHLIEQCFATNAIGPAKLIVAAWPHLSVTRGRVVNVSSMATRDPYPGFFAYAASKAGVELMVRSIAKEGQSAGIKGFAVAPGATETAMFRALFDESSVPREAVLDPNAVASLIVDCATGLRDDDNGKAIEITPDG